MPGLEEYDKYLNRQRHKKYEEENINEIRRRQKDYYKENKKDIKEKRDNKNQLTIKKHILIGTLKINIDWTNDEYLDASKKIIKWCDDKKFSVSIVKMPEKVFLCEYDLCGLTRAYCNGCITELKQFIKNTFRCKITDIEQKRYEE